MRGNHFLVIIAHPVHGRIMRVRVPRWALHGTAAAALLVAITLVGLGASVGRQASRNASLHAANESLQVGFETLQMTADEREHQLESLSDMAYQVSIAYGLRRESASVEAAYGSEVQPAFYASLSQYDLIREALAESRPDSPMQALLANTTPSVWPVRGHITSGYGMRTDPINGKGSFHPGIDISVPYGTPVVASADGYVLSAAWEGALGHCVKITHGGSGFRTVYGHLKEHFVWPGQSVRRGEVIGLVGRSGRTTGKHLHYEVRYDGLSVNPYRYLNNRERDYETSLAD